MPQHGHDVVVVDDEEDDALPAPVHQHSVKGQKGAQVVGAGLVAAHLRSLNMLDMRSSMSNMAPHRRSIMSCMPCALKMPATPNVQAAVSQLTSEFLGSSMHTARQHLHADYCDLPCLQ
jgi:hypothetical protein